MNLQLETGVPVLTVFVQGLLSFFSPCVLPLVPLYVGYLAGGTRTVDENGNIRYPRGKVLINTLFFVVGVSFAFFVLGAALIAVGTFLSSLTDNQGLAAGIGIAVILLNYYSVSLSEYASATALGSVIALLVIYILLGLLIRYVTGNGSLAYWIAFALAAVTVALFVINSQAFEGLLPAIMNQLSLFERFTTFVNGIFDLSAIVYYLTVIAFFLFLSVQSLEKRRYN